MRSFMGLFGRMCNLRHPRSLSPSSGKLFSSSESLKESVDPCPYLALEGMG
jgi:hypothetical protein